MTPFILIRSYKSSDELACQNVVKDYMLSFVSSAFWFCILKEVTIQLIVITWAILFIFLGVPLFLCTLSIPGCIIFIYISVYISIYFKAIEILCLKPKQCFVAELFEPFLLLKQHRSDVHYEVFINEAPYDETYKAKFRRKIIGTVDVKNHNTMHNAAWIYRFAIKPEYPFEIVAEPLIKYLLYICYQNNYSSAELVTTEWQDNERDLFTKIGFLTRQIYHKQIGCFRVMKSQLGYELHGQTQTKVE